MKNNILAVVIVVVVILLGVFLWVNRQVPPDIQKQTSREVALGCTTDMATAFHIHPELHIYVDGKEVMVPDDTGIKNGCMNAIHTHKDRPVLHVEAPVQKDFTLGDFFAVWGKDFSRSKLLDTVVSDGGSITVTVNGEKVDTYENTILRDHDQIVISLQGFEGEADPSRMKLGMKTWIWVSALYNDGKEIKPKQEGVFTIAFDDAGGFSATTDCNRMNGHYEVLGDRLSFSKVISTKMYCQGSQEGDFAKLLSGTSGYHFTSRGQMILDLKFDSGSAVFR